MLQKNLQTNENQYNTTNNPSRLLIFRTEDITNFDTQDRENKSGKANDEH